MPEPELIVHDDQRIVLSDGLTRREFSGVSALWLALNPAPPPPPQKPDDIRPEDFGAAPDGSADSLKAWNQAIDTAKEQGKDITCRPGATYLVSGGLGLSDWRGWKIRGQGATIKARGDASAKSGLPLVTLTRCSDFGFFDLTVLGNNKERGIHNAYSGHNVQISGCADFLFERIASRDAPCDGFRVSSINPKEISTFCHRGRFIDCIADRSGRNGISFIEAHGMLVEGGAYTGSFGMNPGNGLDVEPNRNNAEPGCRDIRITKALFADNCGSGVLVSHIGAVTGYEITHCVFRRNGGVHPVIGKSQSHGAAASLGGFDGVFAHNDVQDHMVGNEATFGLVFMPISAGIARIQVEHSLFRNNPLAGWSSGFYSLIHSRGTGQRRNIVIANNTIEVDKHGCAAAIGMEADGAEILSNDVRGPRTLIGIMLKGSDGRVENNNLRCGTTGTRIVNQGARNMIMRGHEEDGA